MAIDDEVRRELENVADAHMAPGGAAEFVRQFLLAVWTGQFEDAARSLDPQYEWGVSALGLDRLRGGTWLVSGQPRITDHGDEIVVYVSAEGTNTAVIIEQPTEVEAVEFTLRRTADGSWLIWKIAQYRKPDRTNATGAKAGCH